jgi:hypothetical protein
MNTETHSCTTINSLGVVPDDHLLFHRSSLRACFERKRDLTQVLSATAGGAFQQQWFLQSCCQVHPRRGYRIGNVAALPEGPPLSS